MLDLSPPCQAYWNSRTAKEQEDFTLALHKTMDLSGHARLELPTISFLE